MQDLAFVLYNGKLGVVVDPTNVSVYKELFVTVLLSPFWTTSVITAVVVYRFYFYLISIFAADSRAVPDLHSANIFCYFCYFYYLFYIFCIRFFTVFLIVVLFTVLNLFNTFTVFIVFTALYIFPILTVLLIFFLFSVLSIFISPL